MRYCYDQSPLYTQKVLCSAPKELRWNKLSGCLALFFRVYSYCGRMHRRFLNLATVLSYIAVLLYFRTSNTTFKSVCDHPKISGREYHLYLSPQRAPVGQTGWCEEDLRVCPALWHRLLLSCHTGFPVPSGGRHQTLQGLSWEVRASFAFEVWCVQSERDEGFTAGHGAEERLDQPLLRAGEEHTLLDDCDGTFWVAA